MSRKIIGVTVGTTLSPRSIKDKINPVTSINGVEPDENGNIDVNGTFTEADKAEIVEDVLASIPDIPIDQIDPDKVIFPEGLTTTYAIGNVTLQNGMATLVQPGGTLTDFFNVFVDEKNPSTTPPSVSLTFSQAKAYEVGTKITPSYSASLNSGSYTYGPATGVTATSWEVSDSDGNTSDTASGSFPEITVGDTTSYTITAKAQHGDGAIPLTNTKNEYPAGQIKSGSKSKTSSAVTGFRKTFYGITTDKNVITSDTIRGLAGKSTSALTNNSTFTVNVTAGAMRVIIAYPATLNDLAEIKDTNSAGFNIESSFTKSRILVEGVDGYDAAEYKMYVMESSVPMNANTYPVIFKK
jgi:hypothetical protein